MPSTILIYEFLSGGGLFSVAGQPVPSGSLLREGSAMADSIALDFAAAGHHVRRMMDGRISKSRAIDGIEVTYVNSPDNLESSSNDLAADCDFALVIAPETDDILRTTVARLRNAGANAIASPDDVLRWTSDKTATIERLQSAGVPAPTGHQLGHQPPHLLGFPCVAKPNQGAGSENTFLVDDAVALEKLASIQRDMRLEHFVAGRPASVAALLGAGERVLLAPCWQHITPEDGFRYRGGCVMQRGRWSERALALAHKALEVINGRGWVGIDMVLGSEDNGSQDFVIEINPRLTTSYIGLRNACNANLADAMLKVFCDIPQRLDFPNVPNEFTLDSLDIDCETAGPQYQERVV